MSKTLSRHFLLFIISISLFMLYEFGFAATGTFTARDILEIKNCDEVRISPDGQWIAYTVRFMRDANDEPGSFYKELFLVSTRTRQPRPFITGKVSIGTLRWSPDSSRLGFILQRGKDAKAQVWVIAIDGGEAVQITESETSVKDFLWHPQQDKIAYLAETPVTKAEKTLGEKGYGFIFYEENLKHINLYLMDLTTTPGQTVQLTQNITAWEFCWSPDGNSIVLAASKNNLVDESYMFKKFYRLDIASRQMDQLTNRIIKIGSFRFSPDSKRILYTGGLDTKDHGESQLYVLDVTTKKEINLVEPGFPGHLLWGEWQDNNTILMATSEGVWNNLGLIPASGGKRTIIYQSRETGIVFKSASFSKDFKHVAFAGNSPAIPGDLFYWNLGKKSKTPVLDRLTELNPWLNERKLGKQEIIQYKARDGWDIEGLLVYPVEYKKGERYPLIIFVHGGPESHYSQGWVSDYSAPAQVMAGNGYVVFFPNYRASTGYGVAFAMAGYQDAAGKEFDDIADGIDYLVSQGIADRERVGLAGGSYGGYAAAWFASYYTKYVRAVCMFVGITDLVSKRGTTDIPYEELYVHSGKKLEEMWEESLKRSPIYWAHQSQTAVLILGGTDDPRVHPSQSLEFYRCLKMNDHPAVRLVQYPGEKHGNRMQPGRIDVLYRTLEWFDWYVKDKKPLIKDQLPPLDISSHYGLTAK